MSTQTDSTPQAPAKAPDKGVGCDALLAVLNEWKKRVARLEEGNDFRAFQRDEFSMDHGERNGIDSCIDDIEALLFTANRTNL